MPLSTDLSKNQIDRLGDRLRKGNISEDDLRLLDSYRRSFTSVYEEVVFQIRDRLRLEPTGRPAKSTTSIIDKLQRESIRLSQMQDIAGCRVIVSDVATQDDVVRGLDDLFDDLVVVDRREHPSHGYRAVHVVVEQLGKLIEVQVRTSLQHLWSELSEKLSDVVDGAIKYGGGDEKIQTLLSSVSAGVVFLEASELALARYHSAVESGDASPEELTHIQERHRVQTQRQIEMIRLIGEVVPQAKGQRR
jgi:putative GTP pyrophosphokinase